MKTTKRQTALYSFYDHTGIAAHLEKMAAKGWMLEAIRTNGPWRYRRMEPKKLRFAVTYFPTASDFKTPDADQQEFLDLCQSAGWDFVAQTFQMQIFCNEDPKAVPLETEPAVQVENIHSAMWSNFLPGNIAVAVLFSFLLLFSLGSDMEANMVHFLSNIHKLLLTALCIYLILYEVGEIALYYLWRHKALRCAEEGGRFCPVPSSRLRHLAAIPVLIALLVPYTVIAGWKYTALILFGGGLTILAWNIGYAARDWMKKKGVKTWVNRVLTFLVMWLLILGSYSLRDWVQESAWFSSREHRSVTYQANGQEYTAYCDPLPLTIGSFRPVDDSLYSNHLYLRSTPLASITSGSQYLRRDTADPALPTEFFYHVFRSPLGIGLDSAQRWHFRDAAIRLFSDRLKEEQSVDPSPFGAQAAWMRQEDGWEYLLRCEDRVIQIFFPWEPTHAELLRAVEVLGAL